jgi:hypothetical protein
MEGDTGLARNTSFYAEQAAAGKRSEDMARRRDQAAAALAAVCFAALGVAAPAAGQAAADEGVWMAVSLRGKVSADAPWRWTADSFVQSREGVRALDLAFEQVMVTRDVGRQVAVGFGYGVGAGFRNRGALLEHRLTQLLTWSGGVHARVSLRSLLEERFITGRDAMLLRFRQQVRVVWPLPALRRLRGVASAEVLVQADSRTLTSARLDGNRLFVGVNLTLTPGSMVEIGYLNAYSSAGSNRRRSSHVLAASLAVSLPQGRR